MMIFGADETMLDPLPRKKVVVPKEMQIKLKLSRYGTHKCHVVSQYCRCFTSSFIILSKLKNFPNELNELS